MDLDLSGSVTRSNVTDADDIVALKRVLNRLGYYKPFPKIGMNEFTDEGVFTAIKAFQKDHDVFVNGQIRPGDGTERALNAALDYAGDDGHYIWRTVQDDHVRADHAARAGRVFSWADHPQPGDEFGCRCWAEMVKDSVDLSGIYDPPIKPVYPESLLLLLTPVRPLYTAWRTWFLVRDTEWRLGEFKSETRWGNQLRNRKWTPEQITETLKYGTKFKAPNKVNPANTATRYEYKDRFIVRDDQTKEILQVSGRGEFKPNVEGFYNE